MAGSVADISIKVVANANGVGPPLSAAEKQLIAFDNKAREIGGAGGGLSKIAGSFTSIGVAAAAMGIGYGLINTIKRLDDLGDLADGLGDTAQNLSRLHFAAEQLGSSGEAVDSAMAKMTKAIGTAGIEGGPALDAINGLGLSVDKLQKMKPSEAFIAITNALSRLPNVYDKASVASKLFGKGAIEIISILKAGAGEIEANGKRLDELGGTASDASVEQASKLKDQMVEIKAAYDGVWNAAVLAFGGPLIALFKAATVAAQAFQYVAKGAQIASSSIVGMAENKSVADKMSEIVESDTGTGKRADAERSSAASRDIEKTMTAQKEQAQRDMEMYDAMLADGMSREEYAKKTEAAQRKIDEANMRLAGAGVGDKGGYGEAIEAQEKENDLLEKKQKQLDDDAERIEKATRSAIQIRDEELANLDEVYNGTNLSADAFEKRQSEILAQYQKAVDHEQEVLGNVMISIIETLAEPQKKMEAALTEFFTGMSDRAKDYGDALTESVKTPMEKYQEKIEDITSALDLGVISQETYTRATKKAWEELQGSRSGENKGIYSPMLQDMVDFSMPNAGFAGDGSMPKNWRLFSPPEYGPRTSIMASDVMDQYGNPLTNPNVRGVLDNANIPYFEKKDDNDMQMDEQTGYLRTIAENTADMGMVA